MGWRQSENNSFLQIWLELRADNVFQNKREIARENE